MMEDGFHLEPVVLRRWGVNLCDWYGSLPIINPPWFVIYFCMNETDVLLNYFLYVIREISINWNNMIFQHIIDPTRDQKFQIG